MTNHNSLRALKRTGLVLALAAGLLSLQIAHRNSTPVNAAERLALEHANREELAASLLTLFPEGTSRTRVDEVLVDDHGAVEKTDQRRPNIIHYQIALSPRTPDSSEQRTITVMYYSNNTVRQLWITGSGVPVLPVQPPVDRKDGTVFRFEDYDDAAELIETLRVLFPLDTNRETVEKILVTWGQATVLTTAKDPQTVTYTRRFTRFVPADDKSAVEERVWNVTVRYLNNGALSQILLDGSSVHQAFQHNREYFLNHKATQPHEKEQQE